MASHREILRANRRARRKRFFRRAVVGVALVVLVLAVGFWRLWNTSTFALTRIVVAGVERVPPDRITKVVDDVLAGQYGNLLRRRVNWFYPRAALLETLYREFPELAKIKITNFTFGTLRLDVVERQPAALGCDGQCYFLDDSGLPYGLAPQFSNVPLFTLAGLIAPVAIGRRPLPATEFQHLLELRMAVNQLLQTVPDFSGQTAIAVVLTEPADYTFNIRNLRLLGTAWQLLVARDTATAITISRLVTALSSPAFLGEYHSSNTPIQSVDVRFDQKVFYKFVP